jgi:hypothetical protein
LTPCSDVKSNSISSPYLQPQLSQNSTPQLTYPIVHFDTPTHSSLKTQRMFASTHFPFLVLQPEHPKSSPLSIPKLRSNRISVFALFGLSTDTRITHICGNLSASPNTHITPTHQTRNISKKKNKIT